MYKHFIQRVLVVLLVSGTTTLHGQVSMAVRNQPFVLNFTRSQYGAANQNWSVSQDSAGVLYFGNTYGLIEYNGAGWILHTDPEIRIVRSTFADDDGRIYTGSFEEFGYWERDRFGKLNYTSISQAMPDQELIANTTIWRIFRCGAYLFLHSFDRIFVYDGSRVIRAVETDHLFLPMFLYRDRPYFSIEELGLFRIEENLEMASVEGPGFLKDLSIQNIFDITADTSLVFTERHGIYFITGNRWIPAPDPDNGFLKNARINRVIQTGNNRFAIGTIKNGVIFTDGSGHIISRLDRRNGLQNNNVSDLLKERGNKLWIALQQGIDFTEDLSPLSFVEDRTGQLGSVRCAREFHGNLYIGTNHGLFFTDWNHLIHNQEAGFRTVQGLQGHVLSLDEIEGKLFCGYNLGTNLVDMDRSARLSGIGGGSILVNPMKPGIAYQGLYTGIGIYKKDSGGNWYFAGILYEGAENLYLQMDHEGNLWSSAAFKGVYRHRLNQAQDSILRTTYFGKRDGFSSDNNINVFKLGNRLVFANEGKFFTYDYLERTIVPYDWLNRQLGEFAGADIIYPEGDSCYWFLNGSALGRFRYDADSLEFLYKVTYDYLHSSPVDFAENIARMDDGRFVIGLVDGFAILEYNRISLIKNKSSRYPIHINRFLAISNEGDIRPVETVPGANPRIPIRNRNLYVNFSVPGSIRDRVTYRYRLSGQEPWTILGNSNEIRYNHLKSGSYALQIIATEDGTENTGSINYPFTILPAWYYHWMAIILYCILLLTGIFAARIIIRNRIRHNQAEMQEQLKRESEIELSRLKEEYLQRELRNKNKELLNYTILLEKRNDLLRRMKALLAGEAGQREKPVPLQLKLIKTIEDNLSNRDDWQIFRVNFDAANSDFLEKLKRLHPNLTPSDLRFCGFLRMNLTSKEISSLLNISLRSIEVKRYRLRKKLHLAHHQNLVRYLMDV